MSRLLGMTLSVHPRCALLGGFLVREPDATPESLLARVQAVVRAAARRFDTKQLVAIPAGDGCFAVGVAQSSAPRVYDDFAKLVPGLTLARRWNFDEHPPGPIVDEARNLAPDVVLHALERAGMIVAPLDSLGGAMFPSEGGAVDGILAGDGALVYGCLLPNDGHTYQEGRVRTFRSTFDDDLVRIVGVEVARSTAARPVRLGAAVGWEWEESAAGDLRSVLDKPAGYWLVAHDG